MAATTCSLRMEGTAAQVLIETEGRAVATAEVYDGPVVQLRFRIDHGHLPMQVRRRLIDAVFDLPLLQSPRPIQASLPLGDAELLAALRSHCAKVDTRAAGATCLVDAVVDERDDETPARP